MENNLDIGANRQARKYTRAEMARRVLWMFVRPLFRFSPRPCFGWRAFLLRLFGAKLGRNVNIYHSTVVFFPWNLTAGDWSSIGEDAMVYNLGPITLGKNVTISYRAHLCAGTHDYTRADMPLIKPPIVVEDNAWVCTDAFVGPNVRIGQGAIVAAGAVAVKDVPPWTIVGGNPAKFIKKREMQSQSKES